MINFLSQNDLADGWTTVVKRKKYNTILETTIYLSELPPHLWSQISLSNITDDKILVKDKAFKYNIIKTQHDDKVLELYNEINKEYYNLNKIKELYNYCKHNNIAGWIMIKTETILKFDSITTV